MKLFNRRVLQLFLAFQAVIFLVCGSMAQAQAIPGKEELLSAIKSELPDFFGIDQFSLASPSISESGGHRRLIYEFDVAVIASEDLFTTIREVGAFFIVVPTIDNQKRFRVAGLLDLFSNGTVWKTGVSFSRGFERYGNPIDRFGGPTLIAGDPASDAMLARIREQLEADKIAKLRQEIEAKVAAIRAEGEEQVRAERERAAASLLDVIADHATKRGELITQQRQQIAELDTGMASERQSLTRQISKAEDLKQLQARLKDLLHDIARNDALAIQEFAAMREKRLQLLSVLPEKWVGVVRCRNNANPLNTKSTSLEIEVESLHASGFTATFFVNGARTRYNASHKGAAAILDDTISFPLHLEFSAPKLNGFNGALLPEGFKLELTVDGKLRGSEAIMVRWERQQPSRSTCVFELSG